MKPQQPLKQPPPELFWKAVYTYLVPEFAKLEAKKQSAANAKQEAR